MNEFARWFEEVVGSKPHGWQAALGSDARFGRRLIRIPTGFGKTLGTGPVAVEAGFAEGFETCAASCRVALLARGVLDS